MSIFNFFRTAPPTKSKKVITIEKTGKIASLLEAIEKDRHSKGEGGQSSDGTITVKRVGSYSH